MSKRLRSGLRLVLPWLAACSTAACSTAAGDDAPHALGISPHARALRVPDVSATHGSLRALLYNVRGLPRFVTGDDTFARARRIAPQLNAFDLVGLQEDFDAENHALLMAGTRHAHRDHFDAPLPYRLYGAGLTTLSVFPIVDARHEHYAICFGDLIGRGETDCVASKGFQVTRLRLAATEASEVDFYNTHLDAGEDAEDARARARQIEALTAAIADHSSHRAVVLVADTNAAWDELEALLRATGLRDACREVACAEDDRIERVLVRGSDRLRIGVDAWRNEPAFVDDSGTPLSDHPAVSVDLAWQLVIGTPH